MVFKNTAIANNASAISKQKLQQEQMEMLPMQDLISAETQLQEQQMVFKTQLFYQCGAITEMKLEQEQMMF
jgi:hypothetical protein